MSTSQQKTRVAFDAGAKCNENLLNAPNYLSKRISINKISKRKVCCHG